MGALPYFLRDFDVPIYGTRLSLAMLLGQARGAPAQPVPGRGRGRPADQPGPVRPRVLRRVALDPRRHGGGPADPGRHDRAHRRLQDGPDPDRRPPDRPGRAGPAGRRGHRPAHVGLHQRRAARLHRLRGRGRPGPRGHLRGRPAPHRDRLLRQPRPPGPADPGRRGPPRPQGRPGRAEHDPQHAGRLRPRLPAHPGRPADPHGGPLLDRPGAHGGAVHRLPGRAVLGPDPDGRPRPQVGPDRARRHRGPVLLADPGQRGRRLPHHQRPGPARGRRLPQGQRPGARVRPRRPGRADPAAVHPAAGQLRARPRRVPAPGQARPAGRLDRGAATSAS